MVSQRGFALFEVLLALILMMIAAAASYTLVKSFRANSSVQQFIRYSTTISQSMMPFLDGNSYSTSNGGPLDTTAYSLSTSFLNSIGIPAEHQVNELGEACASDSCYVSSGMYLSDGSVANPMSFSAQVDSTQMLANYLIIAVDASGLEVNQVLQSASSTFSVYCPTGKNVVLNAQSKCSLQSDSAISDAGDQYSLFLVFPRSGDVAPADTGLAPVSK